MFGRVNLSDPAQHLKAAIMDYNRIHIQYIVVAKIGRFHTKNLSIAIAYPCADSLIIKDLPKLHIEIVGTLAFLQI